MSDVADPRLSMSDVMELVAGLPFEAMEQLAEGPMPGNGCRVCGVLRPLLKSSPGAAALYGWHEFFEETPALDALTKQNDYLRRAQHWPKSQPYPGGALEEWKRISGMLSYSRCATIYLAAKLELERL